MKWSVSLPPKVTALLKSRKLLLLCLLAGLILVLLPDGREEASAPAAEPVTLSAAEDLERRLEALLSQVDGAGKVQVLLTLDAGEETRFQTDTVTETRNAEGTAEESNTVTTVLTDTGNDTVPVAVQVTAPVYRGAVVVAEGADRAAVRLELTEAVMRLTGLGADRISVIKMKSR